MNFERLEVWQRSYALCVNVYLNMRLCKDYGFRDQITKSSLSIPSNIAEGWERYSDKDKYHFLSYAKGSAGELKIQLMIGKDISYLNPYVALKLIDEAEQISRMLGSLMKACKTI